MQTRGAGHLPGATTPTSGAGQADANGAGEVAGRNPNLWRWQGMSSSLRGLYKAE